MQPGFLGFSDSLWGLGYLAEVTEEFGWQSSSELVLNLGSKMAGRGRGEPDLYRRDAIVKMTALAPQIAEAAALERPDVDYDEDRLVDALLSADVDRSFDALTDVLHSGVKLERIITTFVLLAADRMARTPVKVDAGWNCLKTELMLARSLRVALRVAGSKVAVAGLYDTAWQFFTDRWLNIPARPLSQAPTTASDGVDVEEDVGIEEISRSVSTLDILGVGPRVQSFLTAGHSGSKLLNELGRLIIWNDTGVQLLPTLRSVFEEWENCEGSDPALGAGHPSKDQLLVGLARFATDIRTKKESGSSTTMAMRFAEGRTTVDAFDD